MTCLDCLNCPSRQIADWHLLDDEAASLINQAKRSRAYKRDENLFHEGDRIDGIHCIHSGLVALEKFSDDGKAVVVSLAKSGDTIGYLSNRKHTTRNTAARVVVPGSICFIPGSTIRSLMASHTELATAFLDHAARDIEIAEERMLHLSSGSVKDRLINLLIMLARNYGSTNDDGDMRVEVPFSRRELARLMGSRPETLSRLIHEISDINAIEFSGRHVRIPETALPAQMTDYSAVLAPCAALS